MKYVVKIFLCLLAPAKISVLVDVKSKAATGEMLCLMQDKHFIRLHFQLNIKAFQKKCNYSFDKGLTTGLQGLCLYAYFY